MRDSNVAASYAPQKDPSAISSKRSRRDRISRRSLGRDLHPHDLTLDTAMLLLATGVSLLTASAAGAPADLLPVLVFLPLTLAILIVGGLYRPRFAPHFLDDARAVLAGTAQVAIAITVVGVVIFDDPGSADQAARLWLFAATYVIAARGGVHIYEMRERRQRHLGHRTLIVGAGLVGKRFAQRLLERPEFGLRPVAFLDDDPLHSDDILPIPIIDSEALDSAESFGPGLERAIHDLAIDHVVVSFSLSSHAAELDLVRRCQELGITVSVLPRLFEGVTDRLDVTRLGGIPLLSIQPADPAGWQYAAKYAIDRILALLLLVVVSPILLAAALATLLSLGRPIIFRQSRVGLDGREFDLLKFRTMRPPPSDESPEQALSDRIEMGLGPGGVEGQDRRTRVGRFLRRSSIDELPQLLNVLKGDMSLVGPRPERPSFVRLFDESVYRYADRHRVKSGITGWAQVNGLRGSTSIEDRVEWDNYYIENRSIWLDLKILLLTTLAVARDRGE